MSLAGTTYRPEGVASLRQDGGFSFGFNSARAMPVSGFDWTVRLNADDMDPRVVEGDTIQLLPRRADAVVRIRAGADTLQFDLRPLVQQYRDSLAVPGVDPDRWMRSIACPGPRRAELLLQRLNGKQSADSLHIDFWNGALLLGKGVPLIFPAATPAPPSCPSGVLDVR